MRERDFQYMVIGHVCNLARRLWFGAARRALPRESIFRVASCECGAVNYFNETRNIAVCIAHRLNCQHKTQSQWLLYRYLMVIEIGLFSSSYDSFMILPSICLKIKAYHVLG